jgi:hypothetical protein
MYAISVHQPWAWAILHAGKNVENRTWRTRHRGPLLIHAAKNRETYSTQNSTRWEERFGIGLPSWEELPKGAIVGVVDVVGCVRESTSQWADSGYWYWLLANPRPFDEAIHYRGAQLLFHVPDAIHPGIAG